LKLKCTKFDFGWGSPQTPLEDLAALPTPPGCDALLLREGDRMRKGEKGKEEGGKGKGRQGEER